MSASELGEHLGYLIDQTKTSSYRAALAECITPESVVLDLGAGTGLLGCLAVQAGAHRVYAADPGPILALARQVTDRSGLGDMIVHVAEHSTELTLPELVDVVVCDQIGGFVYDAGILGYYEDAVARLLKPGGTLIPSSFVLRLTPVGGAELAQRVAGWRDGPAGIDMQPFLDAAVNTEHHVNASADSALGPDVPVAQIASDHNRHFGGAADLQIEKAGEVCGLLGTFVAQMSPGVTLTNAPWDETPMKRWQNFYPFAEATPVEPGDYIDASIDVAPRTGMVAWRGTVVRRDGTRGPTFAHDTLRGSFLGPDAIIRAADSWVPVPNDRLDLARAVLDRLDGKHSIDEIAADLVTAHEERFVSASHAKAFVRSVLRPVVEH